ncbi:MAG: response regulator [Anaerolineae bacterium]|jgi:CheY-like chemotaxis protein/MinD-like ATPase involved in chromosome partitioning or flagellar assembly|nr:response regulator [Anaerolineae bacterium]
MAEKILVVDDDVDSLKLIGLMLQRQGYEVVTANTGGQALTRAETDLPNLIILDVMMPDMNGLDVCKRLRQNVATSKIPIIMFTAKTLIDDKVKGFEAGADDYLTKPTHPAELASRVKAILARSAARQAQQQPPATAPRRQSAAIGVMGAKGGAGTTTVALNLAAALLQQGEQPVVADFRPGMGSMAAMIGLGRSQGMARILSRPAAEITPRVVEGELMAHDSGLRGLFCSTRPREIQMPIPEETALATVSALRMVGRPAVFDLGSGLSALNGRLQAEMNRLLLVVEPNPITVNMAKELIQEIETDSGSGRISIVVVNRSQSSLQTAWHDIENTLGREIKAIISAAPELAFQAVQNNLPIVLLQPNAIVAGQFARLAETMKPGIRSIAGGILTT